MAVSSLLLITLYTSIFPILLTVPQSLLKEADPNFFQTTTIPQEITKAGKYM